MYLPIMIYIHLHKNSNDWIGVFFLIYLIGSTLHQKLRLNNLYRRRILINYFIIYNIALCAVYYLSTAK